MNEIKVMSETKNLDNILNKIHEDLGEDISFKSLFQLDLIIEEIFVNIANYAYDDVKEVIIKYDISDDSKNIIISFIDEGMPFNPLKEESPNTSLSSEEREIGGWGIFLYLNNADDVTYEYKDNQNILTIKKYLD
ncbi:MAG: ATP-binding protein [Methanobrevibacter sp.]|nr:ATP-binding protein [Methanobrevibacter sp.]